MNAQIEKKVDVTIELEKKERDLLYDAFYLLEKISDVLVSNDLYDDDYFTIAVLGDEMRYQFEPIKKQIYELDEVRARFDEFLW